MPPLFRLEPLTVTPNKRVILQTGLLEIPQGGHTAIIGPNGAGKSTLLKALLGRFSARAQLLGRPAEQEIKNGKVAWVAQNGRYAIPITVREYAALSRIRKHLFHSPPPDEERLTGLLEQFDLAHLADKRIETLSGGEQQRANIVRALMQQAPAILLDEPCNHLDIRHQHRLMRYLLEQRHSFNAVMVLHDLNLAAAYAQHIILMSGGKIVACGTVDEVMRPELLSEIYQWPVSRIDDADGIYFKMSTRIP